MTQKEETKCDHGDDVICINCGNPIPVQKVKTLSPSDKTWEERFRELAPNGLVELVDFEGTKPVFDFIQQELTSATIKAREIGYQEGFDKGYETASGERHWE